MPSVLRRQSPKHPVLLAQHRPRFLYRAAARLHTGGQQASGSARRLDAHQHENAIDLVQRHTHLVTSLDVGKQARLTRLKHHRHWWHVEILDLAVFQRDLAVGGVDPAHLGIGGWQGDRVCASLRWRVVLRIVRGLGGLRVGEGCDRGGKGQANGGDQQVFSLHGVFLQR